MSRRISRTARLYRRLLKSNDAMAEANLLTDARLRKVLRYLQQMSATGCAAQVVHGSCILVAANRFVGGKGGSK